MVIKRGLVYFDCGRKARFHCVLRDRWKNVRDLNGLSKQFNKTLTVTQGIERTSHFCYNLWRKKTKKKLQKNH